MSITDELRAWMRVVLTDDDPAHAIADRIDAEYKKAEGERKAKDGQMWLKGYAECHAELMEGNEVIAADLEKAGWVRLPKDADGEPISVGDVMMCDGEIFEVRFIRFNGEFWAMNTKGWNPAATRHYHKPTVEDVLREMCLEIDRRYARGRVDYDALFTEYAKKLREVVEHERD